MYSVLFCLVFFAFLCESNNLVCVRYIVVPGYARLARMAQLQGTVSVEVEIGHDGKVFVARGSGAHPLLVREAEKNVREWRFGPFLRETTFPLRHKIDYVYKLEGDERYEDPPPRVVLSLPDRVEITSHPPKP